MTPFFSIIVPTYNQARYLPDALDTLLAQTCPTWEAVIVNDGSSDDTPRVMAAYAGRDERFRPVHKQNGGVATALNEGLRHARGEWICWLSSDDLFEPDALAIFAEALRQNPDARFFHSEFSEMDDHSGVRTPSAPGRHLHLPDGATQVIAFFRANYVHGISIAVHRSVFEAVGTFNPDLRYAQDVDMWLRISARYRLHHIDRRTCVTRVHGAMGTVGFTEAGPMDVARSCLDFLNRNRFAALFPFLDLRQPEHLVAAVNATMQTMMALEADMYRGIGFVPALLERFGEWLWCDCDAAVRETVVKALVPVAESLRASLPERLSRTLAAILTRTDGAGAGYRPHDYYRELAERYHELLTAGTGDEAGVLERYMKLQKGEAAERLGRELARISTAAAAGAPAAAMVGSRLAHRWLDGLKGLEIGASAHNAFGLNTRNVGMRDAIYEAEQMRLTGTVAPIHIEALADAIPVGDESEDFIFSSHVIEHCPDLIKTLLEWFRIVRNNGLIYMIVPHRDASPSDAGRPLTEWQHVLADFANQADGRSEPEAGQLGHCHYHVFDIAGMRGFIGEIFGRRLELVDYQEVDDKIGNGFTLVYRKTVSLAQALPWSYWERLAAQKAARNNGEKTAVNIGMITYNRLAFTRQAIDALVACTDHPYVLTVVDNNSEDGTQAYLQELKARGVIANLVLLDENIGVAKASNIAWSLVPDAGYYLKLDNDIVVQKRGWLSAMVRILEDTPQVGALAYSFEPTSYPLHSLNGHPVRLKNGNLGGACFLIPARTRERLGYWCEDYGLYSEEDFDYCYRMYLAGIQYAYMEDEAIGFHLPAGRAAKIDEESLEAADGVEEEQQQAYRLWKDEIRRQTIRSGLRDSNLLAYKSGTKPLYAKSEAFERWAAQGRPGLSVPGAAAAPAGVSPLKVAVFSHDDSSHACGYYRLYSPARALPVEAEFRWPVKTEGGSFKIDLEGLDKSDLFIIQRFFPHEMSMPVIRQLMATGKPVVFEVDDYITAIPRSNPSYEWAQQCIGHMEECIRDCDAVTVSTDALKEAFSRLNPSIFVLPNLIDDTLWEQPVPPSGDGRVVIGFTGTNTHIPDIAFLEETLERIAAAHPGEVAFTFMGCATERLSRLPGFRFIPFETTYQAYARTLQQVPMDIALVPLEDNPFNRCKSNVKWLEYSACGVAGIYADLPAYNTTVEHGVTGILAGSDPQQWFNAIDLLIRNRELRRAIALNARQKVLSEYTVKKGAHRWLDVYRQIIAARGGQPHHRASAGEVTSFGAPVATPAVDIVVSIIIPLFNRVDLTKQCLEGLARTVGAAIPHEIILVDNGSTDGTADYLRAAGDRVAVIGNGSNQGFARACNQGARAARGKYLLFLNNDTVPQPGWLEPLVRVLEDDPAVAAAGSKLLYPDGTIQHAGVVMVDNRAGNDPLCGEHIWRGRPADLPEANEPYRYQALTAACLLVRRTAFEAVAGFDEGYWNGYEDVDLCFKLGQRGWPLVYQPRSVVVHHESKSGPERFTRVAGNIERLHRSWLGKITPDMVVRADGRAERTGAAIGPYGMAGTGPAPRVSIVIPLYNQAHLTKACVEAVRATAGDPGRYELILVDNGSRDWTGEYVKSLGAEVTVITNGDNLGFARACNQGAQAARGAYLLFLNNDTKPQAGWLDALLAGADEDGADIVGGKLLYPNGRVQHAGVAFNRNGIGYHIFRNFPADAPAVNKKRSMQCVTAACLLVSRQLFLELGGFDEHFRNGFEDVDFCLRAGQAGKKVLYTPHALVIHHEEQSEGRKQFDAQNMQRYLARWQGKVRSDDEAIYSAEGFSVQWHADGSCTIRQRPAAAARPAGRYPLVPLVGAYAETPLARLAASPRMKAVLKAYSGGSGAGDIPPLREH
ncbi:glycosyltransferase [Geobacter sp. FeAm09]|uniref:glycosyltransferase n=1 Tax=Geobacter sp. FeAm09 TaxID=2597769 RepID=UPI0011ED7E14|nr:glycosyltransferase [Geobacter sp. FeAm09]QEM69759.1 glycosyltransferase [Geobacter sp. FeAm09]